MAIAPPRPRNGSTIRFLLPTLMGLGLLAGGVLLWRSGSPTTRAVPPGELQHLSILPFDADSAARRQLAAALADSLVARLATLPGLDARVGSAGFGRSSDLTIRGNLAARDGRLVITARLYGAQDQDPLWTATFWRKESLNAELVTDLSQGLAEAIYGHLARTPKRSTREQP